MIVQIPYIILLKLQLTLISSHQCGSGSNPGVDAICGLSLLLVLSFAPRGFSPGTPVFPSPQKLTFPNSNSTRNQVDEEPPCGCATSKSLFIYLVPSPASRYTWLFVVRGRQGHKISTFLPEEIFQRPSN